MRVAVARARLTAAALYRRRGQLLPSNESVAAAGAASLQRVKGVVMLQLEDSLDVAGAFVGEEQVPLGAAVGGGAEAVLVYHTTTFRGITFTFTFTHYCGPFTNKTTTAATATADGAQVVASVTLCGAEAAPLLEREVAAAAAVVVVSTE